MEKVFIEIEMENGDVMKGELYPEVAPITEGLDIVDQIANVPTNFQDCPTTPVVIKTIRRV